MRLLTIWLTAALGMLGSLYFAFEGGVLQYIWHADITKLTFVIMAVFAFGYAVLGKNLYKRYLGQKISEHDMDPGLEAGDLSMALGMLGTVVGFIFMTSSFVNIDFSGVESIRQLFSLATNGMSTALYTTAAGLISSITLRTSFYILNRLVSKK